MWMRWRVSPPSSLGNPPHRVVTFGKYVIMGGPGTPKSFGLLPMACRGTQNPCIGPAGEVRFLYKFMAGVKSEDRKKTGKKKIEKKKETKTGLSCPCFSQVHLDWISDPP